MLIDITLKLTPEMVQNDSAQGNKTLTGHLGTHFDVMDREFPLEYTSRKAVVFDVSSVKTDEINVCDIDLNKVHANMFVAFYSGYIEDHIYGTKEYYAGNRPLSYELIDALLDKGVSIIGVDFGGIRLGKEHVPIDHKCADRGTFVIENLCNLKAVVDNGGVFQAHTYPMNYVGSSGLPCRVIAEVDT